MHEKRLKIVEIARQEIGTTEIGSTNQTKYGKWFGLDGVKWCGIFVSYCYYLAGVELKGLGFKKGFAGCQYAVSIFKKRGWITDSPTHGDIAFFDYNGDGRYDHCGIYDCSSKTNKFLFIDIEGNTSIGNNSNGDRVMDRNRLFNKHTIFVHVPIAE